MIYLIAECAGVFFFRLEIGACSIYIVLRDTIGSTRKKIDIDLERRTI